MCKEGYYILLINETYSYCAESYEGFYLDKRDLYYKPCYSTCKTCKEKGVELKHNCIKCKDNYPFEKIFSYYKNCYNENFNQTKKDEIEQIIKNFQFDLINNFNSSLIDKKRNLKIEEKNISIVLTSVYNEKIKERKNETSINLGDCEYKLKEEYPIKNESLLYILKIEVNETGMKIPKIEYEVYYPLYDNNLVLLNLSVCKNTYIELSIPAYIDDDIDKYNQSSDYYNDICSKTTSKYGTDICLKDRQKEFIDNNMTLCEENCYLIDYNNEIKKAKCSCKIKISLPLVDNIEIDTNKLYKSFTDINSFANIKMMKCLTDVINKNDLKNNAGFFIIFTVIISFFIILCLFLCNYYDILKEEITKIVTAKKNIKDDNKNILNDNNTTKNGNNQKNDKINLKNNINNYKKKKEIKENKEIKIQKGDKNKSNKKERKKSPKVKKKKGKKNKRTKEVLPPKENSILTINNNKFLMNSKDFDNSQMEFNNKDNEKYEETLKLNDYQINSLSYKDALESDKRTYIQYYISLLKINHLFIFTFFNNTDYNSKIIKIFLFIFSFTLNLIINALFFNDKTMHKIYEDKGSFNFIYQLPKIIYSSLISIAINMIIKQLALTGKDVLALKQEKNKKELDELEKKLLAKLKMKFSIFFILAFFLLLAFWYFITCFCGVYKNTQIHLISDSIIGFITSLIYPFGIYLIPGIFRITALKAVKKDKSCVYKFSKLLQMIWK